MSECPVCGSENVSTETYHGSTGVYAPDGYAEMVTDEVMVCEDCHNISEVEQ